MKVIVKIKRFKLRYIFWFPLCAYALFMIICNICSPARVYYEPFRIVYNGDTYVESELCDGAGEPYALVWDETSDDAPQIRYAKSNIVSDFFSFFVFFEPYCESFDKHNNFIRAYDYFFISPLDEVLVKEDFVLPTIENNEVDEVWFSHSNEYDLIKDETTVSHIIECARNKAEKELDSDVYNHIKEKSANDCKIWLKYKDYPIVEEFYVTETEDGRYIVDQYTEEEYDLLSLGVEPDMLDEYKYSEEMTKNVE